eukprot:324174-Pleurochrysis_carterae.AAC.1
MALYPASCMQMAEDEEATEEGVEEPLVDAGEDPPPTTLGVVDEILSTPDSCAQRALGKKATRARDKLLQSMDPHGGLRQELELDKSFPDEVHLRRKWRDTPFPMFTSGK